MHRMPQYWVGAITACIIVAFLSPPPFSSAQVSCAHAILRVKANIIWIKENCMIPQCPHHTDWFAFTCNWKHMASHGLRKIKRITATPDHDWKELFSPCIVSFSFTVEQMPNLTYNRPSIIKEFAAPRPSWNDRLSIWHDRYPRLIWWGESSTEGKTQVGKPLGDWLKLQVTRGLMAMAIRRPLGSR